MHAHLTENTLLWANQSIRGKSKYITGILNFHSMPSILRLLAPINFKYELLYITVSLGSVKI